MTPMAIAPSDNDQEGAERNRLLVEAHRVGDPDAFATIVRDHYRMLLAQAERSLGNRSEAEDAVQEVFERALRAIDRFGGEYRLAAWLSLITSNVCANHGTRRLAQRRLTERMGLHAVPATDGADESISDPAVLATVRAAIDALPSSQRHTFVLHELSGLSYPQVADELGISEANARARVHRAKVTLRRNLTGIRSALGAVIVLPLSARRLAPSRLTHFRLARSGGADSGSLTKGLPSPIGGADLLPGVTSSLPAQSCALQTGAVQSFGLQQMASQVATQVATQVASSPLGQVALLTAAPAAPRGSLVMAVAAGIAAMATATLAGPGSATLPAAAASRPTASASAPVVPPAVVPPALVTPSAAVSATAPNNSAPTSPQPVPGSAASPSGTSSTTRKPASVWIAAAAGVAGATPASTPTGAPAASTGDPVGGNVAASGGAPSAGSEAISGQAVPVPAACPWLSSFSGESPGQLSPTDPLSGTVLDTLGTDPVNISTVTTDPIVATSASLDPVGSPGTSEQSVPVGILMGTCLVPDQGVLIVDMTGPNGEEVQLRGSLVVTSGDAADAGYLFRGTVVQINGGSSASSLGANQPAGLPWGISEYFVAQILLSEPANTVQLSLAFVSAQAATATGTTGPAQPASTDGALATTTGLGAVVSQTDSTAVATTPAATPEASPAPVG